MEALEGKIKAELASLEEQIATMKTGLVTYGDVQGLRESKELHKKRLLADKGRLLQRREITKRLIEEKTALYEDAAAKLAEDGVHTQLVALEKRWQQLEKQNYQMHQFV